MRGSCLELMPVVMSCLRARIGDWEILFYVLSCIQQPEQTLLLPQYTVFEHINRIQLLGDVHVVRDHDQRCFVVAIEL